MGLEELLLRCLREHWIERWTSVVRSGLIRFGAGFGITRIPGIPRTPRHITVYTPLPMELSGC